MYNDSGNVSVVWQGRKKYIGHIFYMCILLPSGNSVKGHAGSRTQPNFNLISTVQSKQARDTQYS